MQPANSQNEILLSIAIPTYNRAEIIRESIQSYISQKGFTGNIEIIILDNCSSDHTKVVVASFTEKYPNIKYFRNPTNIGAKNYMKALSLGKGKYLKLMNDNCILKEEALNRLVEIIDENIVNQTPIFIYQNNEFNRNTKLEINSINGFVKQASYWITYNNNFGIWKKDFEKLDDKDRYSDVHWSQVDLTLRQFSANGCNLYFEDYYTAIEVKNKAYNLFQLFSVEYLNIYDEYVVNRQMKKKIIDMEKYRLFRYFLLRWYILLIVKRNNELKFNNTNAFKTLMINYKYKPYFYLFIIAAYLKNVRYIFGIRQTAKAL